MSLVYHERPGVYSSYDASSIIARGSTERVIALIGKAEAKAGLYRLHSYAEAKEAGALEPLENILGHAPEGAYDEYSFVFSSTAFAKYFSGLDKLPDDILIAFRSEVNPSSLIGRNDGKAYAYQKEIFKKIVTFGEG